jgi:heat-inducible transcriptional repressor
MVVVSGRPLSARDREILRDIIQTYIVTGEPVSSRTVAKLARHGLSAASIRNVMADLEEGGYLAQPHTSAGRVPTRAGYHLFIESLMQARALPARERRYIDANLRRRPSAEPLDAEALMSITTRLLSEMSQQVGMVLTPLISDTVLKAVDFVPMSDRRVLCVVVAASGFVDSKVIDCEQPIARDELVRIANYLTDNFAGLTLRQIRDRLLSMMNEERAQVDGLLSLTITLARRGLEPAHAPEVLLDGAAALVGRPELADVGRVRRMLDAFEDKARLVQMLNLCMEGSGIRVFIGEDSDLTSALDFSLVATSYGTGDRVLGSLGIFGPSRMEYPRIIPLVHYLGEALGEALADGEQE